MDIAAIQERVRAGNYLAKSHAIQHALKEGFERKHMVEAVLNGKIIEEYPDDKRVLICGRVNLLERIFIYLHVACEYADPVYAEFVTAYIPDEDQWERPDFTRRKRKRK
ncbi:DUF4258 domain-containing protein [bacterium]|nr:DUF4258 domain-containing protein [bacterium]RIK76960.1 MAG: hypothetical protein DCC62_10460 [candidate division KSB1 bacterium]